MKSPSTRTFRGKITFTFSVFQYYYVAGFKKGLFDEVQLSLAEVLAASAFKFHLGKGPSFNFFLKRLRYVCYAEAFG